MRDIDRIKPILNELERIWMLCPDQRFGQLLTNVVGEVAKQNVISDIWYPEDNKWLEYLKNYK